MCQWRSNINQPLCPKKRKVHELHSLFHLTFAPNFLAIHPIVVETFHFEPKNANMLLAQQENSENHQSHEDFLFALTNVQQNFISVHQTLAEILKQWMNQQAENAFLRAMLLLLLYDPLSISSTWLYIIHQLSLKFTFMTSILKINCFHTRRSDPEFHYVDNFFLKQSNLGQLKFFLRDLSMQCLHR